jgi:hypothetical protein
MLLGPDGYVHGTQDAHDMFAVVCSRVLCNRRWGGPGGGAGQLHCAVKMGPVRWSHTAGDDVLVGGLQV